ncbi:hypothetical protein [Turicibacter sanguinis]|uniref:hypothetical protein n=1 Tax=Turicibacter sanguinis TaxID=154288 RepID=UPI0018AB2E01|nr:hypothetical protein [Turicibacter sanguinis]
MSRINRIRIVNLNYNNNAIRIDDELFELGSENTLLSLRNGGGKSVLVQMLSAPFVRKRYRDTSERPFASYFTTNQPTFIMVEWALDHEGGYVLTGLMVRKNQAMKDEEVGDELEIISFVHEYGCENEQDIKHLPIMIQADNQKKLKGFNVCRQLFESYKQDKSLKFDYYDLNNQVRSRAYFTKLEEFQIYSKEWESIIKKVNLKESGLSELFKEAKDEKGLTEKWFLDAIENKMNKDQNRIKEFERLLNNYVSQYKKNQESFKKKEGILSFLEMTLPLFELEKSLQLNEEESMQFETQIAHLIQILGLLVQEANNSQEELEGKLQDLSNQIHRLKHEEQSLYLYELEDEREQIKLDLKKQNRILEQLVERLELTKKQKRIYEAASRYLSYKKASEDVQRFENELMVAKQSNEELLPRKQDLGYTLHQMYEDLIEKEEQSLNQIRIQLEDIIQKQKELKIQLNLKQTDLLEYTKQKATAIGIVHQFDEYESRFVKKYQEILNRNLEGYYEPLFLETKRQLIQEDINSTQQMRVKSLKLEQQKQEEVHELTRLLEDSNRDVGEINSRIEVSKKEFDELQHQLEIRKSMLSYIAFSEDRIFETESILEAFEMKKKMAGERLKHFEREYDQQMMEYQKLESGQVLELPKEIEDRLVDEDIHYVLGMEWLKRNGWSTLDNQMMVKQNPFIPYSLILTQAELMKLKQVSLELFTSFPVPILIRENLELQKEGIEPNAILMFGNLHFYVLFNDELLDEDRLNQLLLLKKREIAKIEESIKTQQNFLSTYDEKIGELKYQKLSLTYYENCKKRLADFLTQKVELDALIIKTQEAREQVNEQIKHLAIDISDLTKKFDLLERKKVDFDDFAHEYENYVEVKNKLNEFETLIEICEREREDLEVERTALDEKQEMFKDQQREVNNQLQATRMVLAKFSHYVDGTFIEKDMEDLLAEYDAITNQMGEKIKRGEADLIQAKERFEWEESQLHLLTTRYNLVDGDYNQVLYDVYAENQILSQLDRCKVEFENQKQQLNNLNQLLKVNEVRIQNGYREMKNQLNEDEVLPKSEVTKRDFKLLISQVKHTEAMLNTSLKEIREKLDVLKREQASLAEFDLFKSESIEVIDSKYVTYDEKQWREVRGILVRDYKAQLKEIDKIKHEISDEVNKLSRLSLFEDDFFRLPLERLAYAKHNTDAFFEQYDTFSQVFEKMLHQLAINIAQIDKEKATVVGLLLDYVRDVHKYLGIIDQNSSIQIRGKSIKMLRIKLSDWGQQVALYELRMNDFIDQMTMRCLEIMEQNQNIEEFIGSQITTKQLYDRIVGTSNVEIRLYKIEENREYQISWEQVSKNSGGEGFLSAFVILSSLLSFMRRDETDLFLTYEEGKVLIMDNPFAQTNAAHLLKPLMDLAKKSNTQLICLSGLGGESIYSRFENIYSLSVVPSSFKKGYSYLKSHHVKGEVEPHLIMPSRIYVEDAIQESLLF